MIATQQKITPSLWFEDQAEEAINFYINTFSDSQITTLHRYRNGPMQGRILTAEFQLAGQPFYALDGGPYFQFTPAVSFFVNCQSEEETNQLFTRLSDDGAVLMPLDAYPFSKKFAWVEDRFGVSWQLNLDDRQPRIMPALMFTGDVHGKAADAIDMYTNLFENSGVESVKLYTDGDPAVEGTIQLAIFTICGVSFMSMDNNFDHSFGFSGAISFYVNCADQAEVDRIWSQMAEGGEEGECGWITDRFGIVWQIVPDGLDDMLFDPDLQKADRAMEAMLKMKKLEIEPIRRAYEGEGS